MMLFAIALGQGTQILVGYKVGAADYNGAYHRLLKSLKWSLVMTIVVVIPMVLFREALLDIFTDNREIINLGAKLLLLGIILEPGRTLNIVIIAALRAAGDAIFPVKMAIVSMWGIAVPPAYFLGITMGYGLVGIWIAFPMNGSEASPCTSDGKAEFGNANHSLNIKLKQYKKAGNHLRVVSLFSGNNYYSVYAPCI